MSFLKEVGFINVVQVPSNDGEDLLCYVLMNKCPGVRLLSPAVVFVLQSRIPCVKIMDIRDRSMPIEHMTTYEKCLCLLDDDWKWKPFPFAKHRSKLKVLDLDNMASIDKIFYIGLMVATPYPSETF